MPATSTLSTGESVLPRSASPPNHLIFLFHPAAMIVAEEEEEGDGKISGEKKAGKQARRMPWQTYVDEPLLCDIDGQRLTAAPSLAMMALLGHSLSPSPRSNLKNLLQ
ncbi:profilin-3-like [Triticum dicoccoides]|uniref:profilin-3-like n=1 Tax=Triticum dicoccoides TaxID=85692 RepID=UPI00188EFCDE|nr:profilin-3-like [Triticum dicoccoides]